MNTAAGNGERSVAIMQPYFFPYIGYYQMVHAVDTFVFYDDVNYIKGGWINRNRILMNGEPAYITVPLQGASPNKEIREVGLMADRKKVLRTIEQVYRKAPYFAGTISLLEDVLTRPFVHIGELAKYSVIAVMDHLGVKRDYRVSSRDFAHTKSMSRADRLIAITKECGSRRYVNAAGGSELYGKDHFLQHGVDLQFIKSELQPYAQFGGNYVPGLSMIDVLMFNSREECLLGLSKYHLH